TEYLDPSFAATNGGGLTPQGFGIYVLNVISFSVIITWVFNHTRGSGLLAILVHTAINWSQLVTSELLPAAGTNEVGPLVAFGLTALVLVAATRGRLGYARAGDGAAPGPADDPAGAGRAVEVLGAAELATNLPPLALAALPAPSPATAHTLTLVTDLADVALFVAIAVFALVAALAEPSWVRVAGLAVAAVTLVRAVASPLGVTT